MVSTSEVGVIERFGKFDRLAEVSKQFPTFRRHLRKINTFRLDAFSSCVR
jgi:hypothetical protein